MLNLRLLKSTASDGRFMQSLCSSKCIQKVNWMQDTITADSLPPSQLLTMICLVRRHRARTNSTVATRCVLGTLVARPTNIGGTLWERPGYVHGRAILIGWSRRRYFPGGCRARSGGI